jgi:hypothetical protein
VHDVIRGRVRASVILLAIGLIAASPASGAWARDGVRGSRTVGFAAPVLVDDARAGGEPSIFYSAKFRDLVYTAHEGDTHIDREGVTGAGSVDQFLCPHVSTLDCAKNHVWIWTSTDDGATWVRRDEGLSYTGFSDPDLTADSSGTIYDTGIDLVNDAVFSSRDGGRTWMRGTLQCHDGDRPWLAGGRPGEVFVTTNTEEGGRELFDSSDDADSCSTNGIPDRGNFSYTAPDGHHYHGTYSATGKPVYDRFDGSVIEPAYFQNSDGTFGVGYSRLAHAADAFRDGGTFQPVEVVPKTTVFSPFGGPNAITMDASENIYFAWDTDERIPRSGGGCAQGDVSGGPFANPTPAPNRIMFVAGKHIGARGSGRGWTFTKPLSLAHQGNARVEWPWTVAAGDGGVAVVWYQTDKMVDPDCGAINGDGTPLDPGTVANVKTFVFESSIFHATDPAKRRILGPNDASGRAIHEGGACNSGTNCVATGQDRRLGDYFTVAVDGRGCVIIASGDTTIPDAVTAEPRITSLPIFVRQDGGPSLTTGRDCAIRTPE